MWGNFAISTPQTAESPKKENRIFYFDILRAQGCLAVVLIHVAAQYWYSTDVSSAAWQIYNICDSVIRWGVPTFVMISGALFLNPNRACSAKKIWMHTIPRMIIAFFFWSTVYALPELLRDGSRWEIIRAILFGHHHMWFIWMITGLYIIVPVLRQIVQNRRVTEYYLLIAVVAAFLIPTLNQTINLLEIPVAKESLLYQAALRACNNSKMYFLLGYPAYFVLGHWLHTAKISGREEWGIYLLGMLSTAATAWMTSVASRTSGEAVLAFYGELSFQAFLQSTAVFTFAKCRLSQWNPGPRAKKTVKSISGASLEFTCPMCSSWIICTGKNIHIFSFPRDLLYIWFVSRLLFLRLPGVSLLF